MLERWASARVAATLAPCIACRPDQCLCKSPPLSSSASKRCSASSAPLRCPSFRGHFAIHRIKSDNNFTGKFRTFDSDKIVLHRLSANDKIAAPAST